jgi:hypothetical protein
MARQFQFFQHLPGGMNMRYEELQGSWEAAVGRIARAFYPRHVAQLAREARPCDVGTWSAEKLAKSNHVTAGKHGDGDRERLQAVLAAEKDVATHLCAVCRAMQYACERWCDDDAR